MSTIPNPPDGPKVQSSCTEPVESSSLSSEEPLDVAGFIRDTLEAEGIAPSERTVSAIAKMVDVLGEVKFVKNISRFFSGLPRTPGSEALQRLILDPTEPLRSSAQRAGCAPSSILRNQRNLARILGLGKNTQHAFGKINEKSKHENAI